jgi:hypothetical protein
LGIRGELVLVEVIDVLMAERFGPEPALRSAAAST